MPTPIVVVTNADPDTLANAICGSGVHYVAATASYTGNVLSAGTYSNGSDALLTLGSNASGPVPLLDTGIIVSTGKVSDAASKVAPNDADDTSTDFAPVGTSGDKAVFTFQFICDGDTLYVPFIYGSEEYDEFTSFSDEMTVKLNGTNIALVPNTAIPINVTTVNGTHAGKNPEYFTGQGPFALDAFDQPSFLAPNGTIAYDGFVTVNLTVAVVPGATNTLVISVEDKFDGIYDSAVLIGISTSPEAGPGLVEPCEYPITGCETSTNVPVVCVTIVSLLALSATDCQVGSAPSVCVTETALNTIATTDCQVAYSTPVASVCEVPLVVPECP